MERTGLEKLKKDDAGEFQREGGGEKEGRVMAFYYRRQAEKWLVRGMVRVD